MAVTATVVETLKDVLNKANPTNLPDAFNQVDIGDMVVPTKKTYTGLTSAAAHDITDVAHGSSRAALVISSVRVTAGAAAAGLRQIGDPGATPSATVATLSDDGKTITFEAGVTAFVLVYMARSAVDPASRFART